MYLRVCLTYTQYVVVGDLDIDPVVACTSLEGEAIGQIQLPLGKGRIVIRLEFGYPVPSVDQWLAGLVKEEVYAIEEMEGRLTGRAKAGEELYPCTCL